MTTTHEEDIRLAVIVVNYGSHSLLETGLTRVHREISPAVTVVVDSFSTDQERSAVEALCAREGWLGAYPDRNVGFGGGCNLGVAHARESGASRFLLLNPDATIDARSVDLLMHEVDEDVMSLVGPLIVRPDGSVWSAGTDLDLTRGDMRSWRHRRQDPDARTIPWLSGACLLIDAELWDAVGGFDEDYFLYWEDVDLSTKVHRAGGRVVLVEDATAVHDEGGTQVRIGHALAKSEPYYYYNIRNRLLFARKHLDADDVARWRRSSLPAAYQIMLRGGRRQFVRSLTPWRVAWRGICDGYRSAR